MTSLLIAIPRLDRGGPDKVMFEVALGLASRGWDVEIATAATQGHYLRRLPDGIRIHDLGRSKVRLFRRYPTVGLARLVWRRRPEIVLTTLNMNVAAGVGRWAWPRRTRHVQRVANHVS